MSYALRSGCSSLGAWVWEEQDKANKLDGEFHVLGKSLSRGEVVTASVL